jgi:mRNA-degrading endonuclease RelE of RelBE toxin-antitoxin system
MYKVIFSKSSKTFLGKNPGYKTKAIEIAKKFIRLITGEAENLDVKKMKGKWEGFYRIRSGKIRLILSFDVDAATLYVDRIGFRGDVYK